MFGKFGFYIFGGLRRVRFEEIDVWGWIMFLLLGRLRGGWRFGEGGIRF